MPLKSNLNHHLMNLYSVPFRGFLIALSNAWGLFQIIIFLGYGLVTVPKHCLKMSDLQKRYDYCMYKLTITEESL